MLALLWSFAFAAPGHPPGEWLDPAVAFDVTPGGFDAVEAIATGLIPTDVPIPDVYLSDYDEECIDLIFTTECWNWYEYVFSTSGLGVNVQMNRFDLSPGYGRLRLDIGVELTVASRNDPGRLYAFGEVIDLISVEQDCDVWLDPTPINVTTAVDASLVNGQVDFEIRPINIDLDISQLRIQGCIFEDILDLIDVINDVVGFFGFDIYDMIADAAEPLVEQQINALLPELETTLESAFSALNIETAIPVGDAVLAVAVAPTSLDIVPDGMRLGMGASVAGSGNPDPCVSKYAQSKSLATPGEMPVIGDGADQWGHHIGIFVDDDLVNQALHAVWYEGLMCFSLDPAATSSLDLPISLDTALLDLLADGAYEELFPEAEPLVVETRPTKPPTATIGNPHQINAHVEGLGLDMYAELDGRLTRLVGMDVGAEAGLDLLFDNREGDLLVKVAFEPSDIGIDVVYNDLKPEASQPVEDGLGGLIDTIVGPLIGSFTDGLSFPMPVLSGLGLTEMMLGAAGPQAEHLGAYANIGFVPYVNETTDGGCTSGCESGCATGNPAGALPALVAAFALVRRRS